MSERQFTFDFVEKQIRKKTLGILSTVSAKGRAQSTGIMYGVSPPDFRFSIYILTHRGLSQDQERNVQPARLSRHPVSSLLLAICSFFMYFISRKSKGRILQ